MRIGPAPDRRFIGELIFGTASGIAQHGYSIGFAVCGIAAVVCAVVTVAALGGRWEQEEEIALLQSATAA